MQIGPTWWVSVTTTELSQEMSSFSFKGTEFYPQEMLTPVPRQVRGRTWYFLYFWFKSTLRKFSNLSRRPKTQDDSFGFALHSMVSALFLTLQLNSEAPSSMPFLRDNSLGPN